MRKKILTIFGMIALATVAFAGCATVSNIKNDSSELIFNGGTVAQVGDYLYYANAYTPVDGASTDYAYKTNAKLSYLNRANLAKGFKSKIDSPNKTEKVNSKVAGFENSYIFVLGDYVYFTSPSVHKDEGLNQTYGLVSLFRSKLNGDSRKELYTTDQYDSTKAQMRVLKGDDGNYYWIVYDGTDITSVKLGSKLGSKQVLAHDVSSVAMPNENDSYGLRRILFTKNDTETNSPVVYLLDYASKIEAKPVTDYESDLSFVGRIADTVFYTSGTATYSKTLTNAESISLKAEKQYEFHFSTTVKNIYAAGNGYVYTAGSDSSARVFYKTNGQEAFYILNTSDFSQLLYADNQRIYYANGSEIKMANLIGINSYSDVQQTTVVTMSSDIVGKASVVSEASGTYLYYYAGLEPINEDDDKTYAETSNNYLYRVRLGNDQDYQIISSFTRTEIEE